jgi:hypothetical protein
MVAVDKLTAALALAIGHWHWTFAYYRRGVVRFL